MPRLRRRAAVMAAAAGLAFQATPLSPRESGLIEQFLVCFECRGAVDSVRAIGVRKPVAAVDTLNRALSVGPGMRHLHAADSTLAIAFGLDSTYRVRKHLPLTVSRTQYVTVRHDRYVNGYRSRGAIGLGWIHTPRAVQVLDSALATALPPSVRAAAVFAHDSLP